MGSPRTERLGGGELVIKARAGALLATAFLIAACSGAAPTPAPTQAPATQAPATQAPATEAPATAAPATEAPASGGLAGSKLRIVQGSSPDFTQIALTKAIQTLNDEGIETTFQSVDDTQVATNAVIGHQADITVNSLFFGINAVKEGIPLVTIMVDAQTLDYLLVSLPTITDVNQVKKMGINQPGDLGATVADQCLKFAGVDVSTVEFVSVGGTGARMAALVAGAENPSAATIDAAPAHAAEALAAAKEGGLKTLVDCGQAIGSFLQTGATVEAGWLADNKPLAQAFVDAYIDALRWAQDNKDEYIELSKEVIPDMPDEMRGPAYDVLHDAGLFAINGGLTPESIQKLTDIGLDSKSIEEPVPDNWYTMDLINDYLARNGTR
jgi:ABC-type nitrate/sulfonate/bicarbonate transport system substrate-binding protein